MDIGPDMGFESAYTPAHKGLECLRFKLHSNRQDVPLKCPCKDAKVSQVPALLQQGHLVEVIPQIQQAPMMVPRLVLKEVLNYPQWELMSSQPVPIVDDQPRLIGSWFGNQEPSCEPGAMGTDNLSFIKETKNFLGHFLLLDTQTPDGVACPRL